MGLLHLTHQSDERLTNQGVKTASPPGSTTALPGDPHQELPQRLTNNLVCVNQGPTQLALSSDKEQTRTLRAQRTDVKGEPMVQTARLTWDKVHGQGRPKSPPWPEQEPEETPLTEQCPTGEKTFAITLIHFL